MTGIKEAVAEAESTPLGEKIPWSKISDKHGVVRSTLTRKVELGTRSHQEDAITRQNLSPQEEAELVKYIDELTERHLPPTREMVKDFASIIAGFKVSDSWVSRFLHRHDDKLTPQYTTSMDRNRHAVDSCDKYKLYYDALHDKITYYKIEPEHTYNMDEKGF